MNKTIVLLMVGFTFLFALPLHARDYWFGTAPFCAASKNDCTKRNLDFVRFDERGDGSKCVSGHKVLCRTKNSPPPPPPNRNEVWFGTAPFCAASKNDCLKRNMDFVRFDKRGDGKTCATGRKVLCRKRNANQWVKWIGTAPVCEGRASDCESIDMDYVTRDKTGTGARCLSGYKVMCRSRSIRPFNPRGADANTLNVLNANVFARPFIATHDGQIERLAHIPRVFANFANGQLDVIVFEETFVTNPRFYSDLRKAGFRYFSKRLKPNVANGVSDGGVQIVSRWPIVKQQVLVYKNCHRKFEDCLAAKGVIYTKIRKSVNGRTRDYHVFGTHLQAWDGAAEKAARFKQSVEMRNFMNRQHIPASQPVIVVGDLNIDLINSRAEANKVLNQLNVTMPAFADANRNSSEPRTNQLVGADGSADKCNANYLRTKVCSCCRNQYLDYVTYERAHLRPRSSSIRILKPKVRPFAVCMSAPAQPHHVHPYSRFCKRTWVIRDLSDHYPVLGIFRF